MKPTLIACSLLGGASAHTIFTQLHVNGVGQGHTKGIRVPVADIRRVTHAHLQRFYSLCRWYLTGLRPITDVTSNDMICNGGQPQSAENTFAKGHHQPGDKLSAEWHHTLDSKPETDKDDPIDPGHLGPIMVYLAKVDNALTTQVTGLKWFKIYEDGLDAKGEWAVTRLYNRKLVDFVLPTCIPSGQYLLRAEIVALHGAGSYPGAQLYMECAQINVTGGGNASPPTVSFPGAYKGTDPGIKFQLYWPKPTSYTIPGPRPFTCP
ncbi:hypothetical protein J1614_000867 [Plenodomus biglobosus]|nr:hypothetical protein J1614_000867 [Plenodomus biglobosus]